MNKYLLSLKYSIDTNMYENEHIGTIDSLIVDDCTVHFIPLTHLKEIFDVIQEQLSFITTSS